MTSSAVLDKPLHVCENQHCRAPIMKGQTMWKMGNKRFCSGSCMVEHGMVLEEAKMFVGLDGQEMMMIAEALFEKAEKLSGLKSGMFKSLARRFQAAKVKFHETAQEAFKQRHPELNEPVTVAARTVGD